MSKSACIPCRAVKIRCRPLPKNTTCERCTRKSLECVFGQKKRGRKPGSRVRRSKAADADSTQRILHTSQPIATELDEVVWCEGDPIQKGLVSYHVATSLFHGFMQNLNPLVCLLDPVLYTFQYVRQRSSFLLTVILAASAKAFNPDSHTIIHDTAEELYIDCFRRGTKSVESIQAFLLFTYWKQADDTRSWAVVGYAIRLCIELGWHRLTPSSAFGQSEQDVRQRRNIERTWFVMFIHDRGASLQTGRPWMIEKSAFIESVNVWQKHPYATNHDPVVCALATLRLTTADIIEVLNPQRPSPAMGSPDRINPLLRMLKPQLDAWLQHWTAAVGSDPCHRFIVNFYSNHVQLYLYSFTLQGSLASAARGPLIDNNAFWIAYTNAVEMISSISHPTMLPFLGFIHDAVHVMIAYAAVFLVQLLSSVHLGIRREIEPTILERIKTTSRLLSEQGTPATFSCSRQARFLANLVQEYESGQGRSLDAGEPAMTVLGEETVSEIPDATVEEHASNWIFGQDESWANLLMNAGFDIEEGIFPPHWI